MTLVARPSPQRCRIAMVLVMAAATPLLARPAAHAREGASRLSRRSPRRVLAPLRPYLPYRALPLVAHALGQAMPDTLQSAAAHAIAQLGPTADGLAQLAADPVMAAGLYGGLHLSGTPTLRTKGQAAAYGAALAAGTLGATLFARAVAMESPSAAALGLGCALASSVLCKAIERHGAGAERQEQ